MVAAAITAVGQAVPTSVIGIDETRAQSVRWLREQTHRQSAGEQQSAGQQDSQTVAPVRWRRSNPWMTSIVDLSTSTDRAHPGGIIDQAVRVRA